MDPLLRAYALAHRTGLLNTSLGDALFSRAYFVYKRFEDPHEALIRAHPEIFRGGHAIDVGANIGYTTVLFARAIDDGFKVFALEPEEENFARLERNLKRHRVADRVVARRAAAGAASGAIGLRVNPLHHGDHQVDPAGTSVPMVSLDEFPGPIRFVKILDRALLNPLLGDHNYEWLIKQPLWKDWLPTLALLIGTVVLVSSVLIDLRYDRSATPSRISKCRSANSHHIASAPAAVSRKSPASRTRLIVAVTLT